MQQDLIQFICIIMNTYRLKFLLTVEILHGSPLMEEADKSCNMGMRKFCYYYFNLYYHLKVHFYFISICSLSVTTSVYPVPSICAQDQISDWFASLADCLQWNVRKRQQQFDDGDDQRSYDDDSLTDSSSYDITDSEGKDNDSSNSKALPYLI